MAIDTAQAEGLLLRADADEDLLRLWVEHGLFTGDDGEHIVLALQRARLAIGGDQLAVARTEILKAERLLNGSIYQDTSTYWRALHVHQIHVLLYQLIVLVLFLIAGSGRVAWLPDGFWRVPTAALGFGALGAVLRSLFYLYQQVARRIYRAGFLIAHLAAPWIGGLFGMLVYLLVHGGVLAFEGAQAQAERNGSASDEPSLLPLALAFLAGFKWEWLLGKLDSVGLAPHRESHRREPASARDEKPEAESGTPKNSTE